jgi:septum formation protein
MNLSAPAATPLILASSSRYRQSLLARLGLPFVAIAPELDESALPGETPRTTALRLARAKAAVIAKQHPGALVIGSDQVASLDGQPIGKPGNHARALLQLQQMRGHCVAFHTALCLWDGRGQQGRGPLGRGQQGRGMPAHDEHESPPHEQVQLEEVVSHVRFRDLPDHELDAYLRIEQPYDCAGSAKNEGLGIALLESIESNDPTALTGLPLITLCSMLRRAGVAFFQQAGTA